MLMRVMSGIGKKFEKLFKGPLTYVFAHILCVQHCHDQLYIISFLLCENKILKLIIM